MKNIAIVGIRKKGLIFKKRIWNKWIIRTKIKTTLYVDKSRPLSPTRPPLRTKLQWIWYRDSTLRPYGTVILPTYTLRLHETWYPLMGEYNCGINVLRNKPLWRPSQKNGLCWFVIMCHRCLSYEGAVDARRKFMSHNLADKKGKDKVNEFKRLFHYVRVAQKCLFLLQVWSNSLVLVIRN